METAPAHSPQITIPSIRTLCLGVLLLYALVGFFPVNVASSYVLFALAPPLCLFGMLLLNKKLLLDKWTTEVYIFMAAWLIYALFGILWAQSSKLVLEDSLKVFRFLLTFIIFTQLLRHTIYQKYIPAFFQLVFIGYICIYLWEIATGNHLPSSRLHGVPLPIPTGAYFNENNSAVFLLLIAPFLAVKTRLTASRPGKLIALVLFMVMLVTSALQSSRLALIFMLLLGIYYFVFYVSNFIRIATATLVLLAMLVFVTVFRDEYKLARILVVSQIGTLKNESQSYIITSSRIRNQLNKYSLELGWKSGFAGVGGGNYEEHLSHMRYHKTDWVLNAHNFWLEIFANYGVIFFLGIVYLYLKWLYRLWQLRTQCDRTHYDMYNAYFWSLLMFMPLSLIPSSLRLYYSVWIYLAVIHSVCLNDLPTGEDNIIEQDTDAAEASR